MVVCGRSQPLDGWVVGMAGVDRYKMAERYVGASGINARGGADFTRRVDFAFSPEL